MKQSNGLMGQIFYFSKMYHREAQKEERKHFDKYPFPLEKSPEARGNFSLHLRR